MRHLRAQLEAIVRSDARIVNGANEETIQRKIDGFFWPLFHWINDLTDRIKASEQTRCVCIGISCVQGGGKTTTTKLLERMLHESGKRSAVVSLDDVYLTRVSQVELAKRNAANPLLQYRGNPGTHDLPLLMKLIRDCRSGLEQVQIPRYDKSLHGGRGDRLQQTMWDTVQGPLDVLLVEGWCLGFTPVSNTDTIAPDLVPINRELAKFEELYASLDGIVVIKVDSPDWVYEWREQQEQHLRSSGKPALSSDQVRDFVDRFMPAYKAYLPGLYAPTSSSNDSSRRLSEIPRLVLEIDVTRTPSQLEPVQYNG